MDIDLSAARLTPYQHQIVGVREIVTKPAFFLMDEMGAGKTKQTIDAAQVLYQQGVIDRMIVVCPASVRGVWFDPELGELSKHLWETTPARVTEFHVRSRQWTWPMGESASDRLDILITNYDYIRSNDRLRELIRLADENTLLVLDESSAVKNPKAIQTKAVWTLRQKCGRVLLLNGTPIENSPADIYSQAEIMDPRILGCQNFYQFRARYAVMGGWEHRQIVGWHDLEDVQRRLGPYCIRRLKEDCLDLPPKLPPVTLSVPLSPKTWKVYKDMRDDMVAWLDDQHVATAAQAIVKVLRLSQITSGFLGGVERQVLDVEPVDRPDWLPFVQQSEGFETAGIAVTDIEGAVAVSSEKRDFLLDWIGEKMVEDKGFKLIVWCRFRPEVEALLNAVRERYPQMAVAPVYGGQKATERGEALRLMDPRTAPKGPALIAGTLGTGARGLNMTAAHTVVNLSFTPSLGIDLQSKDRVHRPGQIHPVSYFDIEATGPQGQRTVDHLILKALRQKENIATWTTSAWKRALTEE